MQLANPENFKQFIQIKDHKTVTTSETVAKVFGKQHKHVLDKIRAILSELPDEFTKPNFGLCFKNNKLQNGKPQPYFELTKDAFVFLVMGFTGKKANLFKLSYIQAFNQMQDLLEKEGFSLIQQYHQLCGEHKAEKQFASLCGQGLNQWKGKKPVLEATLRIIEDKIQIELPLVADGKLLR
ncbi:Rha family transcriptional regulator [Aggregatibacter kilianii]|jgi:uncharacterized protein HI_1412|uniref:Rha family transcriptional regulator n=1 Tax=Aggregatibacter kilianii TaxID=2025884 RepID=UPI000D65E25F|nr:Rha family transcriptional regulator [Aggregatibacter kilianii]DAX25222.1 MAG TPA: regulatory protein [Bacteriophage sp.]